MRKITVPQILAFSAMFTVSLGMAILTTILALGHLPLGDFRVVTMIIGGIVLLYAYAILIYRAFLAVMPLKEGSPAVGSREEFSAQVNILFYLILFNTLVRTHFLPVPLMRLIYQALGTRMGTNSYSAGAILDPALTVLGDNVLIGHGATLFSHAMEGSHFCLDTIRIGNNVTVGARSVVMSGVEIEDGAIVSAGAVVKKGTRIGPGEIWGGIPARCIRQAKKETLEEAPEAGHGYETEAEQLMATAGVR